MEYSHYLTEIKDSPKLFHQKKEKKNSTYYIIYFNTIIIFPFPEQTYDFLLWYYIGDNIYIYALLLFPE